MVKLDDKRIRQMLKEEVQERIADSPNLDPKTMKCRKDGVRGDFTPVLSVTAEGAAIEYAKANRLPDKSIVHVQAEGRFLIVYHSGLADQAIKLQMGMNDEMIPMPGTIEIVKG